MKKIILSIFFLNLLFGFFPDQKIKIERVYIFRLFTFHQRYEIFCTKNPLGYYKYPQRINNIVVYLTFETNDFFEQSKFDEKIIVENFFYPSNIWTNNKGEVLRFRKRYSPVIEKNRKRKNYPFGFGKN